MFDDVFTKGLVFLKKHQRLDGSFLSLSSPHPKTFNNAFSFHSVFSTALILACLNSLPKTLLAEEIKSKAAQFLLQQKSAYWSFNYWDRNSLEYQKTPYPDDLDDTACALAALYQYDSKLINGSALAKIVTLLTSAETKEGGPYKTWIAPDNVPEIWKDVDLAVNSNIAYFLSLQEISLPNLNELIVLAINKDNLKSPYYSSEYPLIYFISRFFKEKAKVKLIKKILDNKDEYKHWNNSLNTALSISSLLNLEVESDLVKNSVFSLIKEHTKKLWQPHPFYTGVNPKKDRNYYAGSAALTAAFYLEAIAKYATAQKQTGKFTSIDTNQQNQITLSSDETSKQILAEIDTRFGSFSTNLNTSFTKILATILKTDQSIQIKLLPYFFRESMGEKGKIISDEVIIHLGVANLLGWIAYTIYDDFLDDEGKKELLPIANICLRELTKIFIRILPEATEFSDQFQKIMDRLDQANYWEVTNCRLEITSGQLNIDKTKLPNYQNFTVLADKSIGHCLGVLALFYAIGLKKNSDEIKNLLKFFEHYLIARQLNDDAHDWKKDLKMGQINSVGTELLKEYFAKTKKVNLNPDSLFLELEKLFWYKTVKEIAKEIIRNSNQSRKTIKKISTLQNIQLFEFLINKVEQSAIKTLVEQKKAVDFLSSYAAVIPE